MKTKRKLNVRLLRRIQKHILEEPRRFFMSMIYLKAKNQEEWLNQKSNSFFFVEDDDSSQQIPPCGTAACIAGWTNILSGRPRGGLHLAGKILGIGAQQQNSLFITDCWPSPFDNQYQAAKTSKQRAKIACARIDWLIEHGE